MRTKKSTTLRFITDKGRRSGHMIDQEQDLFFNYKGSRVPVTFSAGVPRAHAFAALESAIFTRWYRRCEQQEDKSGNYIHIHGVEIQSVDMFGAR